MMQKEHIRLPSPQRLQASRALSDPMFSVPHLIVLFIVALIVFGPEKLPELARNLGKWTAEFKRVTGDMRSTLDEHMRELEREANERRISSPTPAKDASAALPAATNANAAKSAETSASTDGTDTPPNSAAADTSISEPVATSEAPNAPEAAAPGTVPTDSPYLTRGGAATPTAAIAAASGDSSVNQGAPPGASPTEQPAETLNETLEPDSPATKR
jgi:TatA/E family protein of Tat protein translocase